VLHRAAGDLPPLPRPRHGFRHDQRRPVTAFWCTDLPAAARRLAGGPAVEELAWVYLRWLFGQAAKIFVPGTEDWELLAERGFSPARLELLARRPAPAPLRPWDEAPAFAGGPMRRESPLRSGKMLSYGQ